LREHLAFMHHDHVPATLGLIEIGGRDEHGRLLLAHELEDDLPQFVPRQRVDAGRRFVEQKKIGRAHERAGKPQLLLHAAGKIAREPLREGPQSRHLHEAGIALRAVAFADTVQIGIEVEILLHGQVFVEAEALRHIADAILDGLRLAHAIEAQHFERAHAWRDEPAGEAYQRRLACAVRPHERGQRAFLGTEGDIVQRMHDFARVALEIALQVAPVENECSFLAHGRRRMLGTATTKKFPRGDTEPRRYLSAARSPGS
jgi:hypothetical protein